MNAAKKSNLFFYLILLAYAAYAAVFIWRTSFFLYGERFFVLFDDAMISMQYARNLAAGNGLVFNPGERVEGYTNPLWVAFMALFHLLPLAPSKISLPVQISGGLFVLASLFFVKKTADLITGRWWVGLLAVFLTAFYSPLNNWSLLGMEVSVLLLITTAAVYLALAGLKAGRFNPWVYVLLGVGTLVRTDMAVPYLVVLGFLFLVDRAHRRQNLLWGVGLLVVFLGGQTLFRVLYYGDPLPNTYYLKMSGYPARLRIFRGLVVFMENIVGATWLLFVLPLAVFLFRRSPAPYLLYLVFLGQCAYSVYVGGDAWEHVGGANRYISIAIPLFFILLVDAADLIREALLSRSGFASGRAAAASLALLALFVFASAVHLNFLKNFRSLERWALLRQPIFVEGNKENTRIALNLNRMTNPGARIAVVAAGTLPYFSERYSIDLLGKADPVVAHQKVKGAAGFATATNFRPGHMKWNYDYSIGELKPDIVAQLWGAKNEALPYLNQYYVTGSLGDDLRFSLRAESPNIRWDEVVVEP